jgi:cell division protein FtsB
LQKRKDILMKLKKASIITKIIVFALVIFAGVTIVSIKSKTNDKTAENDALQQQINDMEVQNAELQYKVENSDDDDVLADVARDELGYVGPGEKVFYDSDN